MDEYSLNKPSGGFYPGWRAWQLENSQEMLTVKFKKLSIWNHLALFAIFVFGGIAFSFGLSSVFGWLFPIIMFSLMAIICPCIAFAIDRSYSRGDWLVYDKDKNIIRLPREQITFPKDEVESFQIIVGNAMSGQKFITEVNVICMGNRRYPLMRALSPNLVRKTVNELAVLLGVPLNEIRC